MKSKRARILLADLMLVLITAATAVRSRSDAALVVVMTCVLMISIITYLAIKDAPHRR